MNKHEVGKLMVGQTVSVGGRTGIVARVHEPQWKDLRTRAFKQVFDGADIRLDDDQTTSVFINADDIQPTTPDPTNAP